ncbi:PRD domain-containing protein [Virgibacillus dakarensis]|uniref:LicABCH operon regulator n=1 Tax=Lentibacillus populi TaxID=1827502 RepID=A0A9W5TZW2_9BACI|nr:MULTISPECIES: BglG family transcription antiterminator [Bacillaceae]MBT2215502.1 BglG family transcription antiterminator [Virgibacillus dakarensis]MTW86209.1 PRD domain-containing protein [Virgibacillus dakarensis]GGB54640.1 putative licABCH operon regulator [Lentibacillus populi]
MSLYLSDRMEEIIKILSSTNGFTTSRKIAEKLGVTSRTIREDIKIINGKINGFQTKIISKKSKGYKIIAESHEQLFELLHEVDSENLLFDVNSVTPEDRVRFIMKKLLYSNESIKIESFMEELYVSDSTIKNDLIKVKEVLKKYNIKIVKDNNGMRAKGNEVNKRFCISDYFIYSEEIDNRLIIKLVNSFGYHFSDDDINRVKEIILQELSENDIEITDDTLNKIAIHIIIAIGRIKSGQPVSTLSNMNYLKNESEYGIAKKINKSIESLYKIAFPEQETAYTTLHLVGNRLGQKGKTPVPDIKLFLGDDIFQLSVDIIEQTRIGLKGVNISEDEELIYSLGLHLKQLVTRLTFNMNIRNPLVDEIKIKYPLAFETGVIAAHCVEKETGFRVNENEIGFLALHFGAAIERQRLKPTSKKKIALVCASGMATSELLLTKLSHALDNSYNLIGAYALHQLEELLKQNPDLILTTVTIEKELDIPVVHVPSILDDNDVSAIQRSLEKVHDNKKIISQFFSKELFFPGLKMKTKEETLAFLTRAMIQQGYIDSRIEKSIMERERIASTSIGNMVAIPHPLNTVSNQSFICTAILDRPLKWSDNEEVELVMIILLEKRLQEKFQEIFASLYEIIQSSENVQSLCKKRNFDEFLEFIDSI